MYILKLTLHYYMYDYWLYIYTYKCTYMYQCACYVFILGIGLQGCHMPIQKLQHKNFDKNQQTDTLQNFLMDLHNNPRKVRVDFYNQLLIIDNCVNQLHSIFSGCLSVCFYLICRIDYRAICRFYIWNCIMVGLDW